MPRRAEGVEGEGNAIAGNRRADAFRSACVKDEAFISQCEVCERREERSDVAVGSHTEDDEIGEVILPECLQSTRVVRKAVVDGKQCVGEHEMFFWNRKMFQQRLPHESLVALGMVSRYIPLINEEKTENPLSQWERARVRGLAEHFTERLVHRSWR